MTMKKNKIPYMAASCVAALAAIIIIWIPANAGGQEIESVRLNDEKVNILKLGGICHFIEEEKQSIPYRWRYYISDESLMGVYADEYMDDSGSNPLPGGDKGWRRFDFEARAPGECVITLRYEDVRDGECFMEYIYDIVINEGGITE